MVHTQVPDNAPVLVGAGQFTEPLAQSDPLLNPPMALAASAATRAVGDAGGALSPADIDTIAFIRLFADSAPAWACPFGGSDNPPESVARRIGASPGRRIYSNAGGTQPLQLLAELCTDIAGGSSRCALLAGSEAIASQRFAQRHGLQPDWHESWDAPLDSRLCMDRFASSMELASGMYLPVHYYALIENLRAHQQGNTPDQHRRQMARLLAPFSQVAAQNPYAFWPQVRTEEELVADTAENYAISLPYTKLLVAQDAVNQAAAVVVTSAGLARERGIDPSQWVYLHAYAEGEDPFLSQRIDPGKSQAMEQVFAAALEDATASADDMALRDIYSCFPCAVEAACDALGTAPEASLTVTGGLPYFGGPGNNYSLHAVAEMVGRLRGSNARGLVTANGGILSKHACAILAASPGHNPAELAMAGYRAISRERIPQVPCAENPERGTVISYTVIHERRRDDLAVVLGESPAGVRFLAQSAEPDTVGACLTHSPIGRRLTLDEQEGKLYFTLAD